MVGESVRGDQGFHGVIGIRRTTEPHVSDKCGPMTTRCASAKGHPDHTGGAAKWKRSRLEHQGRPRRIRPGRPLAWSHRPEDERDDQENRLAGQFNQEFPFDIASFYGTPPSLVDRKDVVLVEAALP